MTSPTPSIVQVRHNYSNSITSPQQSLFIGQYKILYYPYSTIDGSPRAQLIPIGSKLHNGILSHDSRDGPH